MIQPEKPRKGILCKHCKAESAEYYVKPGVVLCANCNQNKCVAPKITEITDEQNPVPVVDKEKK